MSSKSLIVFLFCNLCLAGTLFQGSNGQERKPYIVYLGELPESTISVSLLADAHHSLLSEAIGDEEIARESKLYSYGQSFNALAARLLPHEAEILSKKENVVSVFPSGIRRLRTSRSWGAIGMPLDVERNKGVESDLIVGVFDSGIYVPSPSFNDSGYGPPPKKWKGKCVKGKNFTGCNNKVIGARFFDLTNLSLPEEKGSPADFHGHGTHTSSTAAGIAVHDANYEGYIKGTARGGVPSARIAAYKVCWIYMIFGPVCGDMDILAAFDAALHDGVDVISISLGGPVSGYFEDSISIGAFHAMKKGILVVCAGGNDGPTMATVENVAPWIMTVAASSDRKFETMVKLGDGRTFIGTSVDAFTMKHMHPLLNGIGAANTSVTEGLYNVSACDTPALSAQKVKGKIIFCRGFAGQDFNIKSLGGAGTIMSTDTYLDLASPTELPATVVSVEDGDKIDRYLNSTKGAKAWIQQTREIYKGITTASVASFSSRGPQTLSRYILKPDISAPGLDILAAFTQLSLFPDTDPGLPYQIESGTSMATPHVSGAVAYVKSFHQDWSPAAIKSALMTTAKPFKIHITGAELSTGSGQLNPRQAVEPGLVYDIDFESYVSHLCKEGYSNKNISLIAGKNVNCSKIIKYAKNNGIDGLNYPSMHIQVNTSKVSAVFHRTVTYVGEGKSVFKAKIYSKSPDKSTILSATVTPNTLAFTKPYQKKSFKVTLKGEFAGEKSLMYHSASLVWTDGRHTVRSPILVYRAVQNTSFSLLS